MFLLHSVPNWCCGFYLLFIEMFLNAMMSNDVRDQDCTECCSLKKVWTNENHFTRWSIIFPDIHEWFHKKIFDLFPQIEVFEKNHSGNHQNTKMKVIKISNGEEFCNKNLCDYLNWTGIIHQTSNSHTPEQNGMAKRLHRTLVVEAKFCLMKLWVNSYELKLASYYLKNWMFKAWKNAI